MIALGIACLVSKPQARTGASPRTESEPQPEPSPAPEKPILPEPVVQRDIQSLAVDTHPSESSAPGVEPPSGPLPEIDLYRLGSSESGSGKRRLLAVASSVMLHSAAIGGMMSVTAEAPQAPPRQYHLEVLHLQPPKPTEKAVETASEQLWSALHPASLQKPARTASIARPVAHPLLPDPVPARPSPSSAKPAPGPTAKSAAPDQPPPPPPAPQQASFPGSHRNSPAAQTLIVEGAPPQVKLNQPIPVPLAFSVVLPSAPKKEEQVRLKGVPVPSPEPPKTPAVNVISLPDPAQQAADVAEIPRVNQATTPSSPAKESPGIGGAHVNPGTTAAQAAEELALERAAEEEAAKVRAAAEEAARVRAAELAAEEVAAKARAAAEEAAKQRAAEETARARAAEDAAKARAAAEEAAKIRAAAEEAAKAKAAAEETARARAAAEEAAKVRAAAEEAARVRTAAEEAARARAAAEEAGRIRAAAEEAARARAAAEEGARLRAAEDAARARASADEAARGRAAADAALRASAGAGDGAKGSPGSGPPPAARPSAPPTDPNLTRIDMPPNGKPRSNVLGESPEMPGRLVSTIYIRVGLKKNWTLEYWSQGNTTALDAPWPFTIFRPNNLVLPSDADSLMITGRLGIEGKLEQLKMLAAPAKWTQSDLLLHALEQWVFRPAAKDGVPIPVDVLFVIPPQPED
jgi:hypothetical protein